MSQEQTTTSALEMFALRSPELARVLEDQGLRPGHGSPLVSLTLDPADTAPEITAGLPAGAREAVERVARPERVLGLALGVPPDPAEHLWFYGRQGDLDFAHYSASGGNGHHLAWPVDGVTMLDLATSPLALHRGTEPGAISLAMGPAEYCALCAITDFLQLETLRELLTPVPLPRDLPSFGLQDLAGVVARAQASEDPRRMVTRARILSPVPLDFGEDALAAGVASFRESDLLVPDAERNHISLLLHRLCIQLGVCDGFAAVSNWQRTAVAGPGGEESQHWSMEHFALSRGPESLLLLEFQEVTDSGFLVALDDVTPELAFHWLQGSLPIPGVGPWTREPELPEFQEESGGERRRPQKPRFCTACGIPLDPQKRFCTACGAPVQEAVAHD